MSVNTPKKNNEQVRNYEKRQKKTNRINGKYPYISNPDLNFAMCKVEKIINDIESKIGITIRSYLDLSKNIDIYQTNNSMKLN